MAATVTVEDVRRVAELAHLELTPDETASMLHDLNAILNYVAELNELDTVGVMPLAQVSELKGAGGASVLRPMSGSPRWIGQRDGPGAGDRPSLLQSAQSD